MRRQLLVLAFGIMVADLAAAQQMVPVVGAEDVRLRNHSPFDSAMVTLRFEADGQPAAIAQPLRLEAGEELVVGDVIRTLFGLGSDPTGQIVILGPDIVNAQWRASAIGREERPWSPSVAAIDPAVTVAAAAGSSRRRAVRLAGSAVELPTLVRVGDITSFIGSHAVSGNAMIVAKNVIRISNLRHDGSAPGLDLRVGLSTTPRRNFVVLRITARQAFNGATIDLTLPDNLDLNSFDTFTVWCYEVAVIIAEGRFQRP